MADTNISPASYNLTITTFAPGSNPIEVPQGNLSITSTAPLLFVLDKRIATEVQKLGADTIIEMYQLDLGPFGDTGGEDSDGIYRFFNDVNQIGQNLTWQGKIYTAIPIDIEGFELTNKGEIPRPTMRVSNILGAFGAFTRDYDDLLGAKVTRKRTFSQYLDAVNFVGGVNPSADPTVEFKDDVYFVDRKALENRIFIEFELTSSWDVQGVKLPRRQIVQNTCPWQYRGVECSYTGADVADINDNLVSNPAYDGTDACGKRLTSCKIRFPEPTTLPFGGFPGVGRVRGTR